MYGTHCFLMLALYLLVGDCPAGRGLGEKWNGGNRFLLPAVLFSYSRSREAAGPVGFPGWGCSAAFLTAFYSSVIFKWTFFPFFT